jgi:hypothetical protein
MRPCASYIMRPLTWALEGRPTQAVKHTCSGNLGKVKILRYIRSDMYTALFSGKMAPWQTGPCA